MAITKGLKFGHKLFAVFCFEQYPTHCFYVAGCSNGALIEGFVSYATETWRDFLEQMANKNRQSLHILWMIGIFFGPRKPEWKTNGNKGETWKT